MRIALDTLKGASLNVERSGRGQKSIIAIHGFAGSAATWDSFKEAAGSEYSVICPELPGHGKSDSPENRELYDMKHTLKALAELADRLGVDKAHWLGYSLGGRIALAAGISLKQRVRSLTVESGSAGLDTPKERIARIASDEALANLIEQKGIPAFVDYWESLPLWSSQLLLSREDRGKLRTERLANNPVGLANSLRGIGTGANLPLYKKLCEITVPCLFVTGEEDVKYSEIARRMQNSVPRGQLCLAPKSGHTVHLEQPGIFSQMVLRFIKMAECFEDIPQAHQENQTNQ